MEIEMKRKYRTKRIRKGKVNLMEREKKVKMIFKNFTWTLKKTGYEHMLTLTLTLTPIYSKPNLNNHTQRFIRDLSEVMTP